MIVTLKPDLVFLDIVIPEISGFDMLESLGFYDFEVIFISGHDGYGIWAVKCSALDYLTKPVKAAELKEAVRKAHEKTNKKQTHEPLLSRKEITALLKISTATLTNWQRNGLPFHKKGNRVYLLRSEAVSHITSNKMGPVKDSQQFCEVGKDFN